MTKAASIARLAVVYSADFARLAIVTGCALALIAAGQALPF